MDNIIVKKSKIHGRGVFTNKKFKRGEVVIKWKPKFLTRQEFIKISEKDSHYIFNKNNKIILMSIPERYVNHSCDSNTRTKGYSDVATRDIQKGEEITADYGKENLKRLICKCGSKNCQKIIK